ncbi:MAG: hypothetical protein KDB10_21970, partial [Acidimicrobiales bacterium]|nr:hypothetical protein [Acidimicrobiales bacterium]
MHTTTASRQPAGAWPAPRRHVGRRRRWWRSSRSLASWEARNGPSPSLVGGAGGSQECPLFEVGDRVVYPHHGAAVIERKEKREVFGEKQEYLVLKMAHGDLTLSVPAANAEAVGMRRPIAREDVEDLFQLLAKRDVREPSNWSRRFKNHQEKLKSGDVYQV